MASVAVRPHVPSHLAALPPGQYSRRGYESTRDYATNTLPKSVDLDSACSLSHDTRHLKAWRSPSKIRFFNTGQPEKIRDISNRNQLDFNIWLL